MNGSGWFYLGCVYFILGLIALFSLSFVNCAILHPFFLSDFAPYLFAPFLILHLIFVFNCIFAPYLFVNCVILHPLFIFLSDFAPPSFAHFPSFNDDFEQNTTDKRWGAKSLKKKEGV